MIAVDTSALVAILQSEPGGAACRAALERADAVLISAGTLVEALIVAAGNGFHGEMHVLLKRFGFQVVDVTPERAYLAAEAYTRWGKGFDRARLNFGDCFSYALAKEHACPLLFIGNDFAQTDIAAAL